MFNTLFLAKDQNGNPNGTVELFNISGNNDLVHIGSSEGSPRLSEDDRRGLAEALLATLPGDEVTALADAVLTPPAELEVGQAVRFIVDNNPETSAPQIGAEGIVTGTAGDYGRNFRSYRFELDGMECYGERNEVEVIEDLSANAQVDASSIAEPVAEVLPIGTRFIVIADNHPDTESPTMGALGTITNVTDEGFYIAELDEDDPEDGDWEMERNEMLPLVVGERVTIQGYPSEEFDGLVGVISEMPMNGDPHYRVAGVGSCHSRGLLVKDTELAQPPAEIVIDDDPMMENYNLLLDRFLLAGIIYPPAQGALMEIGALFALDDSPEAEKALAALVGS